MFKPNDALAPNAPVFQEPWHAQVLALADTLIQQGSFTADQWATTLGAALKQATQNNTPDTSETYYQCAVEALETLIATNTDITAKDQTNRKEAWTQAYLNTPHGQPVKLT